MTNPKAPTLPSVLPSTPALQDVNTSEADLAAMLGRVTSPDETPIFICAYARCNKLFPSRERLMGHRKREHETEMTDQMITWNA